MTGLFVTFEGGEGSGKTTQIKLLSQALSAMGAQIITTREPGGNAGAEAIRNLLLTGAEEKWHPVSETLLFQAARAEHVERLIKPALRNNKIVLCDRFVDSTLVYQGIAKGLGIEYIRELHRLTLGNLMPDLTLIFDIDPKLGIERARARNNNEMRFEGMSLEFHHHVREGFLMLAREQPSRCVVIDAAQTPEDIHHLVLAHVQRRISIN